MEWIIVVVIRLVIPLLILRWNLLGSIFAFLADTIDVVILDLLGVKDYSLYNNVDKVLDTYMYLLLGYTIFFWKNKLAKNIGLSLLVYRIVGVILYEVTNIRWLLVIFPDVFIFFYLFYLLYKKIRKSDPFESLQKTSLILFVLVVLKVVHEYILHVMQYPIYAFIREHILFFL